MGHVDFDCLHEGAQGMKRLYQAAYSLAQQLASSASAYRMQELENAHVNLQSRAYQGALKALKLKMIPSQEAVQRRRHLRQVASALIYS